MNETMKDLNDNESPLKNLPKETACSCCPEGVWTQRGIGNTRFLECFCEVKHKITWISQKNYIEKQKIWVKCQIDNDEVITHCMILDNHKRNMQ